METPREAKESQLSKKRKQKGSKPKTKSKDRQADFMEAQTELVKNQAHLFKELVRFLRKGGGDRDQLVRKRPLEKKTRSPESLCQFPECHLALLAWDDFLA